MSTVRVLWTVRGLDLGGTENLLLTTARKLDPEAVRLTIAYTDRGADALRNDLESVAEVRCLSQSRTAGPGSIVRLKRLMADCDFDVVHSHAPVTAVAARLASRGQRKRPALVVTHHGAWLSYHRLSRAADLVTAPLDSASLAVSNAVRGSLPAPIRRRTDVLVHGIDLDRTQALRCRRAELRRALGAPDGTPVVVSVANLHPLKDHDTLLRAVSILRDRIPDVLVLLVGEGPRRPDLEGLTAGLGLTGHVRLLGRRNDALELVAAADLFALSSHSEGLPVAAMEALALGVPVVASDVGGVREAVEDGVSGVLVPPRSPLRFADGMWRILRDPDVRRQMGDAAVVRGSTFDAAETARRLTSLYAALADRKEKWSV